MASAVYRERLKLKETEELTRLATLSELNAQLRGKIQKAEKILSVMKSFRETLQMSVEEQGALLVSTEIFTVPASNESHVFSSDTSMHDAVSNVGFEAFPTSQPLFTSEEFSRLMEEISNFCLVAKPNHYSHLV